MTTTAASGSPLDVRVRPRVWTDPHYLRVEQLGGISARYQPDGIFSAPLYDQAALNAAVAAERERAARVCDDEARMRTEAGQKHPEESESRGRCFAAARAAMNCAKGVRGGEVV
jgi:hypothetical protein